MDPGFIFEMLLFILLLPLIALGALGFGCFYGIRRLLFVAKGEPYVPLFQSKKQLPYQHMDITTGSSADDIARVLRKYRNAPVVGTYAHKALQMLDNERQKNANFNAILESKFARGSLSYEKFLAAGTGANEAVLNNSARLANLIQTFNGTDYRAVEHALNSSSRRQNQLPSATDEEKMRLYQNSLSNMSELLSANESLLFELDKLTAELAKLDNVDATEDSTRMLNEIRTLIDETKFYTQN